MKNNKRKKKYLGTRFQKKLLFLVFVSAVVPAVIVALCMYYMIFNMLAWQMVIPETIINNLMPVLRKVNLILAISGPIVLFVIWLVALELSHRIAGPLYRMEKDLDERLASGNKGPIKLRPKDEFKILVEKINKILSR